MTLESEEGSPTFSVVVPCYNRASEVLSTLRSVQAQTFGDLECIVIDDGSDDSAELRAVVESLGDNRFTYLHQLNQGGGAARNTGINAARGQFIAFLDSDDAFLPHKLQVINDHLKGSSDKALYSRALVERGGPDSVWIRPDRAIHADEDMGEYLFVSNQFVQTSTIVMATATARDVMFDPNLRKGQDLDFCVRAHALGVRFTMIDEPLIVWKDSTEVNRTSRHAGASAPLAWLDNHRSLLTRSAQLGYLVTVVAVFRPKRQLLVVIRDLLRGLVVAKVPARVVGRQFLRFALPRSTYRRLVDSFVRVRGGVGRGRGRHGPLD